MNKINLKNLFLIASFAALVFLIPEMPILAKLLIWAGTTAISYFISLFQFAEGGDAGQAQDQ